MVLRGRLRQYWRSWLALSVLVAVAGGFVLAATAAGRRTAAAVPGLTARHGYEVIVYSGRPLPQLSRLPHVTSVTPVPAAFAITLGCASCRKPIDTDKTLINEVPPGQLPRMAMLLSGRMPDPSQPGEVLASFTLARDNGVRVGSVIRARLASRAQLNAQIRVTGRRYRSGSGAELRVRAVCAHGSAGRGGEMPGGRLGAAPRRRGDAVPHAFRS
jgi:hypothetical protein